MIWNFIVRVLIERMKLMNENLREAVPFLIVSIPLILYMIFVLRRIYIYHHPPKELGDLHCFCSLSVRKRQSLLLFGILLLFSIYENISVCRIEYILLSIAAVILLLHSFSRDRIFENGISYNDIYIFFNEIKEIVYERNRGEYWIKTKFPTPTCIYVRLDEGNTWPEKFSTLVKIEKDS